MIGSLTAAQGEYQGAWDLLQEGLAIYRELHNPRGIAASLLNLGTIATQTRHVGQDPRPLLAESMTIWREANQSRRSCVDLTMVSKVAVPCSTSRS